MSVFSSFPQSARLQASKRLRAEKSAAVMRRLGNTYRAFDRMFPANTRLLQETLTAIRREQSRVERERRDATSTDLRRRQVPHPTRVLGATDFENRGLFWARCVQHRSWQGLSVTRGSLVNASRLAVDYF